MLVFADDSGLEVDALGGAPGVRSARFADDREFEMHSRARRDDRNNALLIDLFSRMPFEPRTARFVCALALAYEGQILLNATGTVEGEILAELPPDWKWKVGHRGNAFRNLLLQIEDLA
jgi:XTP/dITP diphosphohydrolase